MTDPTENDLLREILAAFPPVVQYDPAIHVLPADLAKAWGMRDDHSARDRLNRVAEEMNIELIDVMHGGKIKKAFRRK